MSPPRFPFYLVILKENRHLIVMCHDVSRLLSAGGCRRGPRVALWPGRWAGAWAGRVPRTDPGSATFCSGLKPRRPFSSPQGNELVCTFCCFFTLGRERSPCTCTRVRGLAEHTRDVGPQAARTPPAAAPTLMIFLRTAGAWVTRDLLFVGVSPLLRGVLGGKFSSNNSGLRWPPKETRRVFKGTPSALSEGGTRTGRGMGTVTPGPTGEFLIAGEDEPTGRALAPGVHPHLPSPVMPRKRELLPGLMTDRGQTATCAPQLNSRDAPESAGTPRADTDPGGLGLTQRLHRGAGATEMDAVAPARATLRQTRTWASPGPARGTGRAGSSAGGSHRPCTRRHPHDTPLQAPGPRQSPCE